MVFYLMETKWKREFTLVVLDSDATIHTSMLIPFIILSSLLNVVAAVLIWRDTSNRKAILGNMFASLALLIAARLVSSHTRPDMAIGLSFFAAMVLLGRGLGTLFGKNKESVAKKVAKIMIATGLLSLACFGGIYLAVANT